MAVPFDFRDDDAPQVIPVGPAEDLPHDRWGSESTDSCTLVSAQIDHTAARRTGFYERRLKRLLDLCIAGGGVIICLPILVIAAVAVRASMGGPVLFRQVRVGRGGEQFEVLKFRTMKPDRRGLRAVDSSYGGQERRRTHKSPNHPLLTPVGRFLRRYSIDEMPQIFNVLKGEMSVVGPRPELPSVVAHYEPWQHERFAVRPGLTGLWQITARGNGGLMHERADLDIDYVRHVTLGVDLRILSATPRAMFGAHKGH